MCVWKLLIKTADIFQGGRERTQKLKHVEGIWGIILSIVIYDISLILKWNQISVLSGRESSGEKKFFSKYYKLSEYNEVIFVNEF